MQQDQLAITPTDAAKRLGVSASTLACWRVSGRGPVYIKLGRRIGYRPVDLAAWLELRARKCTAQNDNLAQGKPRSRQRVNLLDGGC